MGVKREAESYERFCGLAFGTLTGFESKDIFGTVTGRVVALLVGCLLSCGVKEKGSVLASEHFLIC